MDSADYTAKNGYNILLRTLIAENKTSNLEESGFIRRYNSFGKSLAHLPAIKKALGISGIQTHSSAWSGSFNGQKAQIDLVIDRRDHVISILEMKFSLHPYVIEKKYADELRQKIFVFKQCTQTNKAIFLGFVTTFGLANNEHSMSLVQHSLTMDALFDFTA